MRQDVETHNIGLIKNMQKRQKTNKYILTFGKFWLQFEYCMVYLIVEQAVFAERSMFAPYKKHLYLQKAWQERKWLK